MIATSSPTPRLTSAGLGHWIDRAVAVIAVLALLPSLAFAHDQVGLVSQTWIIAVAGVITGASLLLFAFAWAAKDIRGSALVLAGAVLVGLVTWPIAWLGEIEPNGQPWLWSSMVVASACTAIAFGVRTGTIYLVACAVVYLAVRITPSGGAVSPLVAFEDVLLAIAQPIALMVVVHYAQRAVAELDDSLARTHVQQAEAAVQEALLTERRRLDAIVHDEVMTTLVAAGRAGGHDDSLVGQARQALASLAAAEREASAESPLTPSQFEWLVRDVVSSVAPTAEVTSRRVSTVDSLPRDVVRALAQATREAVLNAERHADAHSITVHVDTSMVRDGPSVSVTVDDDGRGFDLDGVPSERLGLTVSIRERMRLVGGAAEVDTTPGEGTRVSLSWTGSRSGMEHTAKVPVRELWAHPILEYLWLVPFGFTIGVLMTVYTLVGVLSLNLYGSPALALAALVLVGVATPNGMSRLGRGVPVRVAWLIVGLAVTATVLAILAMPTGAWPGHTVWFAGAVSLLLVLVRMGGHQTPAWIGVGVTGVIVLVGALATSRDIVVVLSTALAPLVWLGVLEFFIDWLGRVQVQLVEAQASSEESAAANAATFSRLVLREVWLTDLRDLVGQLLVDLADPDRTLTDADRELCLVTEATLRDRIRAFNLNSPTLSAEIMAARRRGVHVTLVDNRGSALPEGVRKATLKHLEEVVRGMTSGRLVARTAPEGYDDAVTIVSVDTAGSATLTTIDHDGGIAVRS